MSDNRKSIFSIVTKTILFRYHSASKTTSYLYQSDTILIIIRESFVFKAFMILLVGGEKGGPGKTTIATNLAAMRTNEIDDVL